MMVTMILKSIVSWRQGGGGEGGGRVGGEGYVELLSVYFLCVARITLAAYMPPCPEIEGPFRHLNLHQSGSCILGMEWGKCSECLSCIEGVVMRTRTVLYRFFPVWFFLWWYVSQLLRDWRPWRAPINTTPAGSAVGCVENIQYLAMEHYFWFYPYVYVCVYFFWLYTTFYSRRAGTAVFSRRGGLLL